MVQKEPKNCSDNLCCLKKTGLHLHKEKYGRWGRKWGTGKWERDIYNKFLNKSRTFSHFTGSSLYILNQEACIISPRGSCHTMSQIVLLQSEMKKGTGSLPRSDADRYKRVDGGEAPKSCSWSPPGQKCQWMPPHLVWFTPTCPHLVPVVHTSCYSILDALSLDVVKLGVGVVKCDHLLNRTVHVISPKLISPHIRRINSSLFFSLKYIFIYICVCINIHPHTYTYLFLHSSSPH